MSGEEAQSRGGETTKLLWAMTKFMENQQKKIYYQFSKFPLLPVGCVINFCLSSDDQVEFCNAEIVIGCCMQTEAFMQT